MTLADIIIILILVIISGIIIYFSIKNYRSGCRGCQYSKSCTKSKEDIIKYYEACKNIKEE